MNTQKFCYLHTRIVLLICLSLTWYSCLSDVVFNEYHWSFDFISYICIGIIICTISLLTNFVLLFFNKTPEVFIPFAWSIVFCVAWLCCHFYISNYQSDKKDTIENAPYWIKVNLNPYFENCGHDDWYLTFTNNQQLLSAEIHKFSSDYTWGHYKRKGDTIFMNKTNCFSISDTAIFKKDSLYFPSRGLAFPTML